ncbi:hypothetical protein QCA50_016576 [Cerrena zonata]|uniref:RNase H type-1 domain-containing protein n=1 Tax=Cerrena zonata TaxID=2478898 RepID=A0AAW0FHT9_9APHY
MDDSTPGISATALDEVQWWRARLSRPVSTHLSPFPLQELPVVHSNVYTDASIRGVDVSIDRRWLAWRFPDTLSLSPGYIGWAELIAIELALRALIAQGVTSCQIPIHIDCTEAIFCLERGYSRHLGQNVVVRRIVALEQTSGINLKCVHVQSYGNIAHDLADGTIPDMSKRFPHEVCLPAELHSRLVAM